MILAIKPVYNRSAKNYTCESVEIDGNIGAFAGAGYFVTDENFAAAVAGIESGRLLSSWTGAKRAAVLAFLKTNYVVTDELVSSDGKVIQEKRADGLWYDV